MTYYEFLMEKSDDCCKKAINYLEKKDVNLAMFYNHASVGFKNKALSLSVEDADKFIV